MLTLRLTVCFASVLLCSTAFAQQRIEIASEVSCSKCELQIKPFLTLGGASAGNGLGRIDPVSVARDASGNFLIATYDKGVVRYSASGALLAGFEKVAPEGDWVSIIRTDGNSVHLLTAGNRWITTSLEGVVIKTDSVLLAQPRSAALLDKGITVTNEIVRSPDLIGRSLHVRNARNQIVRSFGEPGASKVHGVIDADARELAPADSGRFWSAERARYVIHLLDSSGQEHKTLIGTSRLFPDVQKRIGMSWTSPYPPSVRGLYSDAHGRLWILIDVAQDSWRNALVRDTSGAHGNMLRPGNLNHYFDTIVEVIDPKNGKVLASFRSDPVLRFAGDGSLYSNHGFDDWGEHGDSAFLRIYHPNFSDGTIHKSLPGDRKPGLTESEKAALHLVVSNEPAIVRRVLAQGPWDVVLNEERQALQVLGCNSIVIAHYPVNTTQANKIRKLLSSGA